METVWEKKPKQGVSCTSFPRQHPSSPMITFPFGLYSSLSAQWHSSWGSWEKHSSSPSPQPGTRHGIEALRRGSHGSGAPRFLCWLTRGYYMQKATLNVTLFSIEKAACQNGGLGVLWDAQRQMEVKPDVVRQMWWEFGCPNSPHERGTSLYSPIWSVYTLFSGREWEKYILKVKRLDATFLHALY